MYIWESGASQVALVAKNPFANAGDVKSASSSSGWGRSPGGGHDSPPQCCSHAFQETNSLRSTMQIVECSLLHRQAQGRVSS